MYSLFQLSVVGADSSQQNQVEGEGSVFIEQTKDLKCFSARVQVAPAASQVQIDFSSVLTTGYRWALFSDYPIMYRTNGVSATQKTMTSGSVAPVSSNAPLPYQCFAAGTEQITSLYVQPISGATQTANVKAIVIGDPQSAYV